MCSQGNFMLPQKIALEVNTQFLFARGLRMTLNGLGTTVIPILQSSVGSSLLISGREDVQERL